MYELINTLTEIEQDCLIPNTINIIKYIELINNFIITVSEYLDDDNNNNDYNDQDEKNKEDKKNIDSKKNVKSKNTQKVVKKKDNQKEHKSVTSHDIQ